MAADTNTGGEFTAQLQGALHWDLLIDIDNTNNPGSITRRMEMVAEASLSYDNLLRAIESTPTGDNNGGGIIDIMSVEVNGDLDPEVKADYENLPKSKTTSVKKTARETVTYEVGPGASFKLYRLVFKAPGLIYMTDKVSLSTDAVVPNVTIEVRGRLLPVLKGAVELSNKKMAKLDGDETFFKAELKGEFHWELFMNIDNSKNDGSIKREVEVETVVSISHNHMVRSLKSSKSGTEMGLDLSGGFFNVISVGVKGHLSTEVDSQYETITDTKAEITTTTKKTDTYEVGPQGVLKLYRLVFKGPGVAYTTDTISTNTDARPEVPIEIKGRKIRVLKDIEVVHTDDALSRPDDIILEARGQDPNIRAEWNRQGTDGLTYVWLRPIWTTKVSEGVTGIQVCDQGVANESYQDLMKGVNGGYYKYLKMLREPQSKRRITEIVLWRDMDRTGMPPPTEDYKFSAYRVNDVCLYLAWNARELQ